MVFSGKEAPRFTSPYNNPLVVEMKIASAIIRRILIGIGSSIDIITWDCLKKLTHPGRDIIPLKVNPTKMICLPIRFGDKLKSRNLEVDFLVIDVPMAYNVILRRPNLHKVKAVIAPYLLQLQFEADDGSIGEMHGDQQTAWECYLVNIRPLIERTKEQGPDGSSQADKRIRARPATMVVEALVIHTFILAEPSRPRPEAAGDVEQVSLEEERLECIVQLGRGMTALDRQSLLSLLQEYKDVFAFGLEEMLGITPTVMEH
ncbi:hypothetical protein Cgig2_003896 [Carnegiea gigantea]|uniref:Uncharacterized protein n=1 Tax=Carnegiea gigantea TaxID=171969 RepID=A0A9Q1GQU5_9CARY|nr:hypothetical protein Cgig2_003896 [Carnegiea gigantea]